MTFLQIEAFHDGITYLDNSATTKPCPTAVQRMNKALCENWGNPSSLHRLGVVAELDMDAARGLLAQKLARKDKEVYFTGGGTEANNIALRGAAYAGRRRGNKIVVTAVEHPSVLETAAALEREGFRVVRLAPGSDGRVPAAALEEAIDEKTVLVSVMYVNNETGAVQPVEAAAAAIRRKKAPALLHSDCVQAFGKLPVRPARLGADLVTVSAHKIHGPKGVGALYVSEKARVVPILFGGGQEKGLRPGTESAPLIAGFRGALEELPEPGPALAAITRLRDYTEERLLATGQVQINSAPDALPYILNFSCPGLRSEILLHDLEAADVFVSSGSACAKGKGSYVLRAQGLSDRLADSAIRVSFSRYNTESDADALAEAVAASAARRRRA
ncbi:MAG: cysteine desulfurase [Clostridiales bacterium]|nr:cysteine desulfurase [Clostridiales bacterium]